MENKTIKININGKDFEENINSNLLLIDFIREKIKLTGSHIGCDTSQCGSCMVLYNDICLKSCSVLAIQMDGAKITTIEGISDGDNLHPMQESFRECHGLQCGFCTPGMIISAIALIKEKPTPSEKDIREHLEGNFCRCTGYENIVKSISAGAEKMKG
ncbi:MAG: Carbon monoxide dehydrogenase small chain [Alphaproteobacteria bacterium MarineAlpha9_Bin2]|nr:MAG: Carbon monoxide dehydrogenase small chain [Alphaproteobacteria bacterium MarineAlpha9_Bin2]